MKALKIIAVVLLLAGCGATGQGGQQDHSQADARASGGAKATSEATAATQEGRTGTVSRLRTLTIEASGDENVEVRVEIADEPDEQAKGLMDRTALGEDRGMLFVFPSEEEHSFWMKNTLIPLSIAYIDADGRIVDIQDMRALDDEPPHYVSAEPAQYALEVNGGFFDERGVDVGDRVSLPL
ncbi:MAG: DUF192 domain-containing protein [Actinomycetota bacterium]|nr:DUF192 domain-containing protein [Actinomycetota bacterium]